MERRDFIRQMGWSLVAGWAGAHLAWPLKALAAASPLRLALLADAHLKSGEAHRDEARSLARAVAEINSLAPPPDVVLFAGDLAHEGRPDALDLGREILAELGVPVWMVRGEGDCGRAGLAPWTRRFGPARFCRNFAGVNFLGLDIPRRPMAHGPAFALGPEQRHWLARKLAALEAATPLIIISHAPLEPIFFPWQQWTRDAAAIGPLFGRFQQVICLQGHVHAAGVRGQVSGTRGIEVHRGDDYCAGMPKFPLKNARHLSVPATAWPLPVAVTGTPAVLRPGQGPRGCGWALLTVQKGTVDFSPYLWQA